MAALLTKGPTGERLPLTFRREGSGTLFYNARLKYAVDSPELKAMDQGFRIERRYTAPDDKQSPAKTSFKAGDLVRVTLTMTVPKDRRWVAVTDPLPAGFEAIESRFATTGSALANEQRGQEAAAMSFWDYWEKGGFDHVERHDDRVQLFAGRLSEGTHTYSYIARATTAGTFRVAPARAEEMYEPEVFGRTANVIVEVTK